MGSFVLGFVPPSRFRIRSDGSRSCFRDERFQVSKKVFACKDLKKVFACKDLDLVSTTSIKAMPLSSLWLLKPPVVEDGDMFYNFCTSAEEEALKRFKKRRDSTDPDQVPPDKAKLVGSSHGWLASLDEDSNHVFLTNPITDRHIKLPCVSTLPEPEINLLDGRASVSRLILTSSNPDDGECRAVISYGPLNRLAYCVPGAEWTPLGDLYFTSYGQLSNHLFKFERPYSDFVYSHRQKLLFCVTDKLSEFEGWNISDPLHPKKEWNLPCGSPKNSYLARRMVKAWIPKYPWTWSRHESYDDEHIKHKCWHLHYLVLAQNSDELFHVVRHVAPRLSPDGSAARRIFFSGKFNPNWDYRYPYKTLHFDVYKIDRAQQKLTYMEEEGSLEGLAMFVGMSHSLAVSAADYPHLKPNSIYFTDEDHLITPKWVASTKFGGHDNGVFNYTDKTFSSICNCYPNDYDKITRTVPPPMWYTPTPS